MPLSSCTGDLDQMQLIILPLLIRDSQTTVVKARRELQAKGVKCWMDIDGGMGTDIYDSMAEGVQGAACVICFMSKKYHVSENVRRPAAVSSSADICCIQLSWCCIIIR
eukprot:SAG31_NODE_803_length_12003_cov_25.248593_2_plen_109_part_00